MKNVIKMNESQLHRIIAESVKRVISEMDELDWKTYMNAYEKAKQRGDLRADKFFSKARHEFNDQYGTGNDPNGDQIIQMNNSNSIWGLERGEDGVTNNVQMDYDDWNNDGTKHSRYRASQTDRRGDEELYGISREKGKNNSLGWTPTRDIRHFSPDMQNKLKNASNEFDDYKEGRYKYDKQGGWKR